MNPLKDRLQEMPDMTQALLAREVGTSEAHINKIVNGHHRPNVDLANRIARMVGSTVEALWPVEDDA